MKHSQKCDLIAGRRKAHGKVNNSLKTFVYFVHHSLVLCGPATPSGKALKVLLNALFVKMWKGITKEAKDIRQAVFDPLCIEIFCLRKRQPHKRRCWGGEGHKQNIKTRFSQKSRRHWQVHSLKAYLVSFKYHELLSLSEIIYGSYGTHPTFCFYYLNFWPQVAWVTQYFTFQVHKKSLGITHHSLEQKRSIKRFSWTSPHFSNLSHFWLSCSIFLR